MQNDRRPGYGSGRDALLAATVSVIARSGLRGLTFRAVAEEAGVNNTLVVHHFGTRDALIEAALEWSVEQSLNLSRLTELSVATEEQFRQSIVALISENPELQLFQYEMILESHRRPQLSGPVKRLYASYLGALMEGLQQIGFETEEGAAEALFAALDGLVLQLVAGVDRQRVELAASYLWRTISRRLQAELPGGRTTSSP
jgi:AcrR family transcriptional regulator